MRNKIVEAVYEALKGSRRVKITLKKGVVGKVPYLNSCIKNGFINAILSDLQILFCVYQGPGGPRCDNSNPTITLILTQKFDQHVIFGLDAMVSMKHSIENIEVVPLHT